MPHPGLGDAGEAGAVIGWTRASRDGTPTLSGWGTSTYGSFLKAVSPGYLLVPPRKRGKPSSPGIDEGNQE